MLLSKHKYYIRCIPASLNRWRWAIYWSNGKGLTFPIVVGFTPTMRDGIKDAMTQVAWRQVGMDFHNG